MFKIAHPVNLSIRHPVAWAGANSADRDRRIRQSPCLPRERSVNSATPWAGAKVLECGDLAPLFSGVTWHAGHHARQVARLKAAPGRRTPNRTPRRLGRDVAKLEAFRVFRVVCGEKNPSSKQLNPCQSAQSVAKKLPCFKFQVSKKPLYFPWLAIVA